jgi:16S rRNA (cytidine1402-2'-O)-methyltransferase
VVATPIGNLGDLSPRAREILAGVELILAEDTRHVRKLLTHFGVPTPTRSLHEHNEAREVPSLLAQLEAGRELALLSDAGTPLVADPGFRLVRGCRERGIPVLSVPGPSAVTAALSVSGLPPVPFTFVGFLPPRPASRSGVLKPLAALPHTLVVFISPHRLRPELEACATLLGDGREGVLLAELTKVHERSSRGTLGDLARSAPAAVKGEHTLVVGPPAAEQVPQPTQAAAGRAFDEAIARGLDLPEARRQAAQALGISRKELYNLLMRRADR